MGEAIAARRVVVAQNSILYIFHQFYGLISAVLFLSQNSILYIFHAHKLKREDEENASKFHSVYISFKYFNIVIILAQAQNSILYIFHKGALSALFSF